MTTVGGHTAPDWAGPQSPAVTLHAVGVGTPVLFGEFRCPPGAVGYWQVENSVGPAYHLAFPVTSAAIQHEGRDPTVADPTHVVLYDADQRYRRLLVDPAGDHTYFVAFGASVLADVASQLPPSILDRHRLSFRTPMLPTAGSLFLAVRQLIARPQIGDDLALEVALLDLITRALAAPAAPRPTTATRRSTLRRHRTLVEDTKTLLYHRYTAPMSLGDVAREVGSSPYHLHRTFHAWTGRTIHGYREQLRLRAAAAAIADGEDDLAALAVRLGFANHSHFTGRFRRAFGVTPRSHRRAVGRSSSAPT